MPGDALSEVLHAVRLRGAIFFRIDARAPWAAEAPPASTIARRVMPDAQHVIEWHAITGGACWGGLVGEAPVRLTAGDVVVFPHGDGHVLSSQPGVRPRPSLDDYLRLPAGARPPFVLTQGGEEGPPVVQLVCGFFGCDVRPFNPLLPTLPRMLLARDAGGGGPLSPLIRLALGESEGGRLGGDSMLARISELMFVEVVRRHLETLPPEGTGWLSALRDEIVGKALGQLHARPADPWTLTGLARASGLSRSALAERFTRLVGEPPMQYLARWRMQVASRRLERGDASVAEVAAQAGYASEAAFSRAFKKLVGEPPAAWRRRNAPGPAGAADAATA